MKTEKLIEFLEVTNVYFRRPDIYFEKGNEEKIIKEIVRRLEELDVLKETKKASEDKAYMDYLLEKRQGRV